MDLIPTSLPLLSRSLSSSPSGDGEPRRLPYSERGSLLTLAEMRFFRVLVHAGQTD